MLRPTEPLPAPDAPDVTVIHGATLAAVHAHAAVVVTVTVEMLAFASTSRLVGEIEYEHGAEPAACVTLNVCVAIVTMPVRAVPVFAATLKPTTPLPVPAAPDVTVSHTALLTAVHAHVAVVVTFTVPVLAVEGTFCAVGVIPYVHAAGGGGGAAPAACDTVNVRFAIAMVPVRAAPAFVATANATTALPRPVGPDVTVIHGTSLATAQSQVLCDCTEMDPEPPAAGTFWLVGEIVVLQFGGAADD